MLTRLLRITAALLLLVVGTDKLFGFFPLPTGTPEADAFLGAMERAGYLVPLVAAVEIAAGLSFLLNRRVALFAVVLLPVSINAFLFHLFLAPASMPPTALLLIMNVWLLYEKRKRYGGMFKEEFGE